MDVSVHGTGREEVHAVLCDYIALYGAVNGNLVGGYLRLHNGSRVDIEVALRADVAAHPALDHKGFLEDHRPGKLHVPGQDRVDEFLVDGGNLYVCHTPVYYDARAAACKGRSPCVRSRLPRAGNAKYHDGVKNKQNQELAVCGLSAVRALLERHPERVRRFFFKPEALDEFRASLRGFAERRALYRMVSEEELVKLAGTVHHQGAVAMIETPLVPELDAAAAGRWTERGERILVLDSLGNDHNLGAVVRSAAFFGIGSLVLSGPDSSNLVTTSAYRVAEGGMEWVSLYRVPDAPTLSRLAGPALVLLGADHRGAESVRSALAARPQGGALGLVLGNEETGLSPASRAACSALVRIPGTGALESLNVAQSAAVLLYELACLPNPPEPR